MRTCLLDGPLLRFVGGLALALFILTTASCGYSTKPTYMKSVRTVAVPIFENKTFRRDWEFRLTEALDKNIEARTPFKIAPESDADTILSGTIVKIEESVLTRRYGLNLPQESQLTIVVNFVWKDTRNGRIIVERKEFARAATEIPQLNERVMDAEQSAIERTAAAIVDQLQTDW